MSEDCRPKSWPFRADIPQRYNDNVELYQARGGLVRLEDDAQPFAADGHTGDVSRFFFFCLMQDQIIKESLPGDMAELGVHQGMTAAVIAAIARRANRIAWLFDTFQEVDSADLRGIDADKQREQFTDTSLAGVRARVGDDHVRYVPGHFPNSAEQVPDGLRFCLVHIDCDLYEPILAALRWFYPRMVPGGFLVMHDYGSLAWNGAERAIDEFFADKPESPIPLTDGAGSAVVRRAKHAVAAPALVARDWTAPEAAMLEGGWSARESWGVWGVGPVHTLVLRTDGAALLEADVSVSLLGRDRAAVTVWIQGTPRAVWRMTADENRGVRRVALPPPDAAGMLRIEFHAEPQRPSAHEAGHEDDRELGMALHRIRLA